MFKWGRRFLLAVGTLTSLAILAVIVMAVIEARKNAVPPKAVLVINFERPIVERDESSPFDLALDTPPLALPALIRALHQAEIDPRVKAVVGYFGTSQPSFVQAEEIRDALMKLRKSGKPTYAFATSYGAFGLGNRTYYMASAFETIWLQPVGAVSLTGLSLESPFFKTALSNYGVVGDFMQREEYKSAVETFTRDSFSAPARSQMQGVVDDISLQVSHGIAEGRGWDDAHVQRLMKDGPFTDDEAMKEGLITHIGYSDQLDKEIEEKIGKDAKAVSIDTYLAGSKPKVLKDDLSLPAKNIAVIYATGMIVNKATGGGLGDGNLAIAEDIAAAFDSAADDKKIDAILFRIDSPGGSPEASETIRRGLVHAKAKGKLVIVSMGEYAASGGYWIAMNGDRIFAEPATLTGSIGVFAGKWAVEGLLQKFNVGWDAIQTTPNAGMWSMVHGFTPAQRDRVNAFLDRTYDLFKRNVSDARKIPMDKMPDIAKGRVWTGAQAIKIGLVDQLGGYDDALQEIRSRLKMTDRQKLNIQVLPEPVNPAQKLLRLMRKMGLESSMARLIENAGLGGLFPQIRDTALTFGEQVNLLQSQPVLVWMPESILTIK